jgi:hypothetical protein
MQEVLSWSITWCLLLLLQLATQHLRSIRGMLVVLQPNKLGSCADVDTLTLPT